MYVIACAFRRGVALIGKFFYWPLLTPSWDLLSGTGGVQGDDTVIMKEADVWPWYSFVKSSVYKRIVTKFFWDYFLNSRVCNYGKRAMIGLLQTVIKRFIFIF